MTMTYLQIPKVMPARGGGIHMAEPIAFASRDVQHREFNDDLRLGGARAGRHQAVRNFQ